MNLLAIIALLAAICISQTTASYAIFWFPNAPITKFESTLIIPETSPKSTNQGNVQAVWPGLQTENNTAVLQNVIENQEEGPGEWSLLPYFCCNPAGGLTGPSRVYPGDSLQNVFTLNAANNSWTAAWEDNPGTNGHGAGKQSFSGSILFDANKFLAPYGPFNNALFAIELQQQATWDFGPVTWQNIVIEANTTNTTWCSDPVPSADDFQWSTSQPQAVVTGNTTTCYILTLILENPK